MIRLIFERKDAPGQLPETRVFDRDTVVVGREATVADAEREAVWVLPYGDVSRLQCRFTSVGGAVFVEGLSERSGTFVNGRRILGVTRLDAGDIVRFGNCKLGVLAEVSVAPAEPKRREERAPGPQVAAQASAPASGRSGVAPVAREVAPVVEAPRVVVESPVPDDMSPIVAQAQRWHELGRRGSELLRDPVLLQRGRSWLSGGVPLGGAAALVRTYVESSLHARRARWQRGVLVTGWLGMAVLGGAVTAQVMAKDLDFKLLALEDRARRVCQVDAGTLADRVAQAAEAIPDDAAQQLVSSLAVQIADDGGCLAASGAEQQLRRRLAGRSSRRLGTHGLEVKVATVQGERAATVDAEGKVRVWDLEAKHGVAELEDEAVTVAWSRDERWVVTGAASGAVHLYSAETWPPQRFKVLSGHRDRITKLAIDPQSSMLASGDERGGLRLWSLRGGGTGAELGATSSGAGAVEEIAFDSKSRRLYTLAGERVRMWSLANQRLSELRVVPTEQVTTMAVNARGDRILTGNRVGLLFLWQQAGNSFKSTRVREPFDSAIAAVAFVPNANAALAATVGKDLVHFDLDAPQVGKELFHGRRFEQMAESPRHLVVDGQRALTAGEVGAPEVWDLVKKQQKALFRLDEQQAVTALAAADQSSRLVTGGRDGTVRAWDLFGEDRSAGARVLNTPSKRTRDLAVVAGGELIVSAGEDVVNVWQVDPEGLATKLGEVPERVSQVAISADRRWLAGIHEGTVFVWDAAVAPLRALNPARHDSVRWVAWSQSGSSMVTAGRDGTVIEWRIEDDRPVRLGEPMALGQTVEALAVSAEHVAVEVQVGDKQRSLRVWPLGEVGAAAARVEVTSETAFTRSLVFDAAGTRLAAGHADNRVRTWRVDAGGTRETESYTGKSPVTVMSFAATGELAIGNETGEVIVMHPDDRRTPPQPRVAHEGPVSGLAFGASADVVISTGDDARLVLWRDDPRGARTLELSGHTGPITQLRVDAQGRYAVTASDDGTTRMWPLLAPGLRRLVCERVRRDLSAEEWAALLPDVKSRELCQTLPE